MMLALVHWLMVAGAALLLSAAGSCHGSAQVEKRISRPTAGPGLAPPRAQARPAVGINRLSEPRRVRTPGAGGRRALPPSRAPVSRQVPRKERTVRPTGGGRPLVSSPPPRRPTVSPPLIGRPPVVVLPPPRLQPPRGQAVETPRHTGRGKAGREGASRGAEVPPRTVPLLPPSPPVSVRLEGVGVDLDEMPDEVLIVHAAVTSDSAIDALAQRQGLTVLERSSVALLGVRLVRMQIADGRSPATVLQSLALEPEVEAAQPNHIYRRQQSSSRAVIAPQYAISKLAADGAGIRASGRGVVIAVVDTGIDASHPDLRRAAVEAHDVLGASNATAEPAHATAIAGIIAADGITRGIARDARLLSLRAFASFGPRNVARPLRSTSMVVLKAIDAAVAAGARVLNLSFAGPSDALLERLLAAADARLVVAIAAAGNGGAHARPAYPAAYASVIAVTATDASDRLYEAATRGAYVEIAAPGVEVLAASADHGHELVSGTSFATAYVSGLAALLLEAAPDLATTHVRTVLIETAVDLGTPGRDDAFGAGLANAEAALAHRLVKRGKPR